MPLFWKPREVAFCCSVCYSGLVVGFVDCECWVERSCLLSAVMSVYRPLVCLFRHGTAARAWRTLTTWSPVGAAFNARVHRRLDIFHQNVVRTCLDLSIRNDWSLSFIRVKYKRCCFVRACLESQSSAAWRALRWSRTEPCRRLSSWWRKPAAALQESRPWRYLINCQTACAEWQTW